MRTLYSKFVEGTGKLCDVRQLLFRFILVVGFSQPAMMKMKILKV